LELEFQHYPAIRSEVRIIETLGPSPIPPWVILKSLSQELRKALRELLLHMHEDPQGRGILADGLIARFAYVEDGDYDAIRSMARQAKLVTL
jgi:phosphonate transport system substrate-binding protein